MYLTQQAAMVQGATHPGNQRGQLEGLLDVGEGTQGVAPLLVLRRAVAGDDQQTGQKQDAHGQQLTREERPIQIRLR